MIFLPALRQSRRSRSSNASHCLTIFPSPARGAGAGAGGKCRDLVFCLIEARFFDVERDLCVLAGGLDASSILKPLQVPVAAFDTDSLAVSRESIEGLMLARE